MEHLTPDQLLRLELVRLFAPIGRTAPETASRAYGFIVEAGADPVVPTDADSTAQVEQALRRARHGLDHPELETETQLTRDQIDRALKRLEAA
ncbi:hypothetical protein, partial [Phenylobacterium sp.]|uniref:hypothetical protein n=1 Tax=Phenylobacterium sp. TaxID=1871053 RepID=UPI0019B0A883